MPYPLAHAAEPREPTPILYCASPLYQPATPPNMQNPQQHDSPTNSVQNSDVTAELLAVWRRAEQHAHASNEEFSNNSDSTVNPPYSAVEASFIEPQPSLVRVVYSSDCEQPLNNFRRGDAPTPYPRQCAAGGYHTLASATASPTHTCTPTTPATSPSVIPPSPSYTSIPANGISFSPIPDTPSPVISPLTREIRATPEISSSTSSSSSVPSSSQRPSVSSAGCATTCSPRSDNRNEPFWEPRQRRNLFSPLLPEPEIPATPNATLHNTSYDIALPVTPTPLASSTPLPNQSSSFNNLGECPRGSNASAGNNQEPLENTTISSIDNSLILVEEPPPEVVDLTNSQQPTREARARLLRRSRLRRLSRLRRVARPF